MTKQDAGDIRRILGRAVLEGREREVSEALSLKLIPNSLRTLVRVAIEDHLPRRQFKILKAAAESERTCFASMSQRSLERIACV